MLPTSLIKLTELPTHNLINAFFVLVIVMCVVILVNTLRSVF
jgi:hypothetical protein